MLKRQIKCVKIKKHINKGLKVIYFEKILFFIIFDKIYIN